MDKENIQENVYYLIRWRGFDSKWDTWEPVDNLLDCLQLIQDFEAKRERSSKMLDSVLEAVARGTPQQSPKRGSKGNTRSPVKNSSASKSSGSKKNKSSNKPYKIRHGQYKFSVKSVKGVKDAKIRKRLAREKGKLFIDMKVETYTPTKNESAQALGEDEKNKITRRSFELDVPKVNSSPQSTENKGTSVSPKKKSEDKNNLDQNESSSYEKNLTTGKPVSSEVKTEELSSQIVKSEVSNKEKKIKAQLSEKAMRDKKYKNSLKFAMKVKLKPTMKVKNENMKSLSKKKQEEKASKQVKKKTVKDGRKNSGDSLKKKKEVKKSNLGNQSIKEKSKGEKLKKSKTIKRKGEEDFCIIECSTSDTDDEPLSSIKVKKLKRSQSDLGSKKREEKNISPKLKDGSTQSVKVKPKQLTVSNVKRKLEVRVQPLGAISKSKKIKLIDSKRGKEMAKGIFKMAKGIFSLY